MIMLGMLEIVIGLVAAAHLTACLWYGIGSSDGNGWVEKYGYDLRSTLAAYSVSMHWSLTQVTGGQYVHPQTDNEHLFSVFACLVGFLASAHVVSNFTSLLTRFQFLKAKSGRQMNMLHRWLIDNKISSKLATRVMRNAQHVVDEARRMPSESSVELLKEVSAALRADLHYEINSVALVSHPFFKLYDEHNSNGMRYVCNGCHRVTVSRGDILFSDGEISRDPRMLFVLRGTLLYDDRKRRRPKQVTSGRFVSEVVLWATNWVHIGSLRVAHEGNILELHARQFRETVMQFKTKSFFPATYARKFIGALNEADVASVSELFDEVVDVDDLAQLTFFGEDPLVKKMSSRGKRRMTSSIGFFNVASLPFRRSRRESSRTVDSVDRGALPSLAEN
eukprot:TRINITY_DN27440_c0_g1_i1.p2 TRINITY_DN27440_c0_g1~~TRINITY_DN27440_c0_g1_i1.p2  ORF type:complete len:392 (+),score=102.95 TRINITY_DN27440_c0_g1_i1:494-1669(+)